MAKSVRETAAGQSIGAWVVLNKKGAHVATVNAHYANSGRVTVDVINHGEAVARSVATALKTGRITAEKLAELADAVPDYIVGEKYRLEWAASDLFGRQTSSAGGYGYDKEAAAMRGLILDGHTLADHCGTVPEAEKARARILKAHQRDPENLKTAEVKAAKIGAHFANWRDGQYSSLHFIAGLERLEKLGYRVIRAI